MRVVLLLLLMIVSASAQTPPVPTPGQRLGLLEDRLALVKEAQVRAQRAHDAWINRDTHEDKIAPGQASSMRTGEGEWKKNLDTIKKVSDEVYPDASTAKDVNAEPNSGDKRSGWRRNAMPKINALIQRMTDEIASIRSKL